METMTVGDVVMVPLRPRPLPIYRYIGFQIQIYRERETCSEGRREGESGSLPFAPGHFLYVDA